MNVLVWCLRNTTVLDVHMLLVNVAGELDGSIGLRMPFAYSHVDIWFISSIPQVHKVLYSQVSGCVEYVHVFPEVVQ